MRYDYQCENCGQEEERSVPVEDRDQQICSCGAALRRLCGFKNLTINIPMHFGAQGSSASDILPSSPEAEANWRKMGVRKRGSRWV